MEAWDPAWEEPRTDSVVTGTARESAVVLPHDPSRKHEVPGQVDSYPTGPTVLYQAFNPDLQPGPPDEPRRSAEPAEG